MIRFPMMRRWHMPEIAEIAVTFDDALCLIERADKVKLWCVIRSDGDPYSMPGLFDVDKAEALKQFCANEHLFAHAHVLRRSTPAVCLITFGESMPYSVAYIGSEQDAAAARFALAERAREAAP